MMGENIGISRKCMKTMIKEIDVNNDQIIEDYEWIEYIRMARIQDKLEVRGLQDNNILLDLLHNEKGDRSSLRNKKNVNLNDD